MSGKGVVDKPMDGSVDNLMHNLAVAHRLPHRPPTTYPRRLFGLQQQSFFNFLKRWIPSVTIARRIFSDSVTGQTDSFET